MPSIPIRTHFGSKRFVVMLLASLSIALLMAACGDAPTTEAGDAPADTDGQDADDQDGTDDTEQADAAEGTEGAEALQAVYDEVEGLDPEARRERLLELAEDEEGDLSVYGTLALATAERLVEAFEEETGIGAELYRATGATMTQRLSQEDDAEYPYGADVVFINDPELSLLANEGLFLPLRTPISEDIQEEFIHDEWIGFAVLTYAVAWNADTVDDPPTTWEEALTYDGSMILEVNSYDLFASLVEDYFVAEQGMTEEEAVDLFRQAADGAQAMAGKPAVSVMLAAGEVELAPTLFMHLADQQAADDSPVAWEPPVEPLVGRANGVTIPRHVSRPASALLYADFMLTTAQEILAEDLYPATNTAIAEELDDHRLQYDLLMMDIDRLNDERQYWTDLYEEVLRGAEVIEGN
jgi:iron(III) transport system substrate-binding protein